MSNMDSATQQPQPPSSSTSSRPLTSLHPALILVTIVLLTYYYFHDKEKKTQTGKQLPGPRGVPFLGCLPSLISNPLGKLREYAITYGPVYSMKVGPVDIVMLNTIEALREAFVTKSSKFNDRPGMMRKLIGIELGLVVLPSGKFHNEQKRLFGNILRTMDNDVYDSFITTHIEAFSQTLIDSKGSPIEACPLIKDLIFSCIGQLVFGINTKVNDIRSLVDGNLSNNPFLFLSGKAIPESVKPKLGQYIDLRTNFQKSLGMMIQLVEKKRQSIDYTERFGDIVNGYLHMYETIQAEHQDSGKSGSPFVDDENSTSNEQLATILMDCYQAGVEPGSAQAMWAFLYLARNVHVQRKIRAEMDEVIGKDNTPSLKHKKHLVYTLATINEIQRMRPVASLGAPHQSTTDATICGYDIPSESLILTNIWAIHMDPKHWHEPEEFRPERFIDADGNLTRPDSFAPFSIGSRRCPGENIVKNVLYLVITNVLRHFTLTMAEEPATGLGKQGINFSPYDYKIYATPCTPVNTMQR